LNRQRFFMLQTASLSALGYENNLSQISKGRMREK